MSGWQEIRQTASPQKCHVLLFTMCKLGKAITRCMFEDHCKTHCHSGPN